MNDQGPLVEGKDSERIDLLRSLIAERRYDVPAIDVADAIITFHRMLPPFGADEGPDGEES